LHNNSTESNEKANKFILEQLHTKITTIVRIFNNKKILACYSAFEDIKRSNYQNKLNEIKAKQIYQLLFSSCETMLKFYSKGTELRKYKCFYRWKNEGQVGRDIEKMKSEIEVTLEKKISTELNNLETKITEKEKESTTLKSSLSKYMQMEADFLKKIKQYEDSENEYLAKINKLEVR
jgi:hypothetical protein